MEFLNVKLQTGLIVIASLLAICLLAGGCAQGLDAHLDSIVEPYCFSLISWERQALSHELNQWISGSNEEVEDEVDVVLEYFAATGRIKTLKSEIEAANADSGEKSDLAPLNTELNRLQEQQTALESTVERIIEGQIRDTLTQQGIFNPVVKLKINFPPVNFKLDELPRLLVISPRDRIESMREILLQPGLTLEEIEGIEAKADKLGVSSLVVNLGGLSTPYPTLVTNGASLRFTINTATEEWLHQYLVFKPLGFLYLLDLAGVSRNYEIATMNETLAGMVSKEIGSIVYERYYLCYEDGVNQNQTTGSEFDFNREMREIRKAVDEYLAQGEVEQAEEFMGQKRQYLASVGHYIRKLNQAYFAFHGAYADSPTSISPIGLELKELRSQSTSLKNFLNTVAVMTSRQELRDSLK